MTEVYYVKNVSQENFEKLLRNLDLSFVKPKDFVALKTHFGEDKCVTYISPKLYSPLVKILAEKECFPFYTDTNTIYVGKRANAVEHLKIASEHGFSLESLGIPVIIADGIKGNDYVEVEINLKHFVKAKIASNIYYSDALICLTHFKGHMLFGFGGSIKNLGMGCAARPAKFLLHNAMKPKFKVENCIGCGRCISYCPKKALKLDYEKKVIIFDSAKCVGCGECVHICDYKVFSIPWDLTYKEVQERTVECAYAVVKDKIGKVLYINFLMNVTQDCDCINKKQIPKITNIGIVAGYDPVAVDYCSLNLVNEVYGKDLFKEFWPKIDYLFQLDYAEEIGLGSKQYKIVEI
ncbi:MAG: DUF362 domain-containing protein [Endomicrobia bacterium]|nr:DUF362 domain-containing protein [Endomicrobiia bacterium]